jgi:hypothetical protein
MRLAHRLGCPMHMNRTPQGVSATKLGWRCRQAFARQVFFARYVSVPHLLKCRLAVVPVDCIRIWNPGIGRGARVEPVTLGPTLALVASTRIRRAQKRFRRVPLAPAGRFALPPAPWFLPFARRATFVWSEHPRRPPAPVAPTATHLH